MLQRQHIAKITHALELIKELCFWANLDFNTADTKAPNTEQNISQNNNLSNQNENKAQMSFAERIYMLRGSSSVIQRTNTSRK